MTFYVERLPHANGSFVLMSCKARVRAPFSPHAMGTNIICDPCHSADVAFARDWANAFRSALKVETMPATICGARRSNVFAGIAHKIVGCLLAARNSYPDMHDTEPAITLSSPLSLFSEGLILRLSFASAIFTRLRCRRPADSKLSKSVCTVGGIRCLDARWR